jgi:hypothetical protein
MNILELINFYMADECPWNEDEAIIDFNKLFENNYANNVKYPLVIDDNFVTYLESQKSLFHRRTLQMKTDKDFIDFMYSELLNLNTKLDKITENRPFDKFIKHVNITIGNRINKNIDYLRSLINDDNDVFDHVGVLNKNQKMVLLYELGILDYLRSSNCPYVTVNESKNISINKIAGILTEIIDLKQSSIQPSLNKLMSLEGTFTKSNIDSAENENAVISFLKKQGLTKR